MATALGSDNAGTLIKEVDKYNRPIRVPSQACFDRPRMKLM